MQIDELVDNDALILESKFQPMVWNNIMISCPTSKGGRCILHCNEPCPIAIQFIEVMIKLHFREYAKWN